MSSKPKHTLFVDLATLPPDVVAAAQAEDAKVKVILREARKGRPTSVETPESIKANAEFMDELHLGSERALLSRIERKELIPKDELVERLGGNPLCQTTVRQLHHAN